MAFDEPVIENFFSFLDKKERKRVIGKLLKKKRKWDVNYFIFGSITKCIAISNFPSYTIIIFGFF